MHGVLAHSGYMRARRSTEHFQNSVLIQREAIITVVAKRFLCVEVFSLLGPNDPVSRESLFMPGYTGTGAAYSTRLLSSTT